MNNIEISYEDDDNEEITVRLPAVWAICDRCTGNGAHSHEIGAITSSEWAEDWSVEERETYMNGGYDKTCEVCHGSGKVQEVDVEHLSDSNKEHYEAWMKQIERKAQWDAEDRATYRMESGGY